MWHPQVQQTRPGIQNASKFGSGEVNNWEDLLDSGYIDRQFSHMNFNASQAQRVPPPVRQQVHPVPLMSVITTPPPNLLNQGYVNGNNNGLLGRHPPPQMIVQQRPRFQRAPVNNFVRQPQLMPIIDTSVPPPRLPHIQPRPALMQRPPPPQNNTTVNAFKGPLTNTDLSPPFSNTPVVKVVGEDEHRTQYTAPGPKVKILKRPSSTPSNLSSQGGINDGVDGKNDVNGGITKSSSTTKSLKQREEEYAQARLRILGSTGTENGNDVSSSSTNTTK